MMAQRGRFIRQKAAKAGPSDYRLVSGDAANTSWDGLGQ